MNTIEKILIDYQPDIIEDNETIYTIKQIILKELNETDRAILMLYVDESSMEKVAKRLGVSTFTIWAKINSIREQIKIKLKKK